MHEVYRCVGGVKLHWRVVMDGHARVWLVVGEEWGGCNDGSIGLGAYTHSYTHTHRTVKRVDGGWGREKLMMEERVGIFS